MEFFVEAYRLRGVKVGTDKRKVTVLAGGEGLECKVIVYGT